MPFSLPTLLTALLAFTLAVSLHIPSDTQPNTTVITETLLTLPRRSVSRPVLASTTTTAYYSPVTTTSQESGFTSVSEPYTRLEHTNPCPINKPMLCLPTITPDGARLTKQELTILAARYWPLYQVRASVEVAWCESRGKVGVVGAAGELGLWQIMPNYWAHMKPEGDPFDAATNAEWAAAIWAITQDWRRWTCKPTPK